ncbi:hypothetical protein TSH100_28355 [Azospirillum sp. TSH100]|uniref:hypothetical protein n=1 Tax=Azospirillum sp. TSH100 TaxID=652764 RepID=UPI000D612336|nr:hypothetical protein [Azospirillum sp. TSH100]PWC80972.1 hypothetical protein TSH100_28355 [Azospirillum sp. TSH100]QCG87236.1 hypothetical protein E6C72_05530 [Azospirillum sp. TSH100]
MRSPFRSLLSALTPAIPAGLFAAALAVGWCAVSPAHAEEPSRQAPKAAAQAKPGAKQKAAKVMLGSPMTKVRFSEPAYPLTDDGTYRTYMDKILEEYGRRCVRQEQFGWEVAKDDQERLDHIFQGTMANYGRMDYLLGEIHPKAVTDPETIVFLGDREKERYLLVWAPLEASVLFMLCDTADKDAKADQPKTSPKK